MQRFVVQIQIYFFFGEPTFSVSSSTRLNFAASRHHYSLFGLLFFVLAHYTASEIITRVASSLFGRCALHFTVVSGNN